MWYRFAHMDRNFVKAGDKVKKGQKIGTVGNGNGQYWAHLHLDVARHPITTEYPVRTKEEVRKNFYDPYSLGIDWQAMTPHLDDVGNLGYDWLQQIQTGGYHPGVDINASTGGNTDFGKPIYSPIDGEVTYEWRGNGKNGGWGNVIVIKKEDGADNCCDEADRLRAENNDLRKTIKDLDGRIRRAKKELG